MRLSEVHDEDVLTPKEVGLIIRKSASYVRKAIASGALPGHRLGPKSILIKGKAIREWAEANQRPDEPEVSIEAIELLGLGASHKAQRYKGEATYFIGEERRKPETIKIGHAINALQRLRDLQIGSPTRLRIWALLRGNHEAEYHRRFLNFRLHGEWFQLAPAVVAEIKRINETEWPPV